jgi:hypothetical protein
MPFRTRLLSAGALILALIASGCGGTEAHPPEGAVPLSSLAAPGRTTFELFDISSFRRYHADYSDDMSAVTQAVADRRGRLLFSVIDGQPITTARVLSEDFSRLPPGVPDPDLIGRFNQAKALALRSKLTRRIEGSHEAVSGSGILEGLEVAAGTPGLRSIVCFTDGVVNEPDGFNVTNASPSEVDSEIQRWTGRLHALRGVTVVLVGAGRGVHRSETVDRSHRLFGGISRAVGARLIWTQTLAQATS